MQNIFQKASDTMAGCLHVERGDELLKLFKLSFLYRNFSKNCQLQLSFLRSFATATSTHHYLIESYVVNL